MMIDKHGDSELQLAADSGNTKEVARLLLEGLIPEEINYQNPYGNTALYLAANHNHLSIVNLLLVHGADKTLTNVEGKTAADAAITQRLEDICVVLGVVLPPLPLPLPPLIEPELPPEPEVEPT